MPDPPASFGGVSDDGENRARDRNSASRRRRPRVGPSWRPQRMQRSPNIVLLGLVFALGLPACQTKVSECNKLADIVNDGVSQIGKIENRVSEDPVELAKDADEVAELAEKTATAVGALTIE